MSFILDALKKSETERQRQREPGFSSIPEAGERPRRERWFWILAVLLSVNVLVLTAVLLFTNGRPSADDTTAAAPSGNLPGERHSAFADIVAEARRNRPEQEPVTTSEPQRGDAAPVPAASPQRQAESQDIAGSGTASGESPRAPSTQVDTPGVTLAELQARGRIQLPELHLDIHVYSEQPADRFVFINMAQYREGDRLGEGPTLRHITPEGVILEHGGTSFLLPRQ